VSLRVPEGCEYLQWDSRFFARRIGRLTRTIISSAELTAALEWADREQIECLYLLVDPNDRLTVVLAESHGFSLVDIRVTLSVRLDAILPSGSPSDTVVRLAQGDDLPVLRGVARRSHTTTRFYFDANFPRERCDALYERWIEQSCAGWADAVLVPIVDDQAAGYISCHVEEGRGRIGLVAIAESQRGRGLGVCLTQSALEWFRSHGIAEVSVVAQGRNIAAMRTYERCGFGVASVMLSYHRWSPRS